LGQGNPEAVMPALESFRALFSAAQGDLDAAGRWAQTAGLDVDGEISFLGEPEYIILARVLIAQGALDKAGRLVARLLEITQRGERWARVIELLVLQNPDLRWDSAAGRGIRRLVPRPGLGRTRGIRAHLCGRRPADGATPIPGRRARDCPRLCWETDSRLSPARARGAPPGQRFKV